MRLNIRSVPPSLIGKIDSQLAQINQRRKSKMTRSQFLVEVLTATFSAGAKHNLSNSSPKINEMEELLKEHLEAEKLLIGVILGKEEHQSRRK